jgi:hypothetical protein
MIYILRVAAVNSTSLGPLKQKSTQLWQFLGSDARYRLDNGSLTYLSLYQTTLILRHTPKCKPASFSRNNYIMIICFSLIYDNRRVVDQRIKTLRLSVSDARHSRVLKIMYSRHASNPSYENAQCLRCQRILSGQLLEAPRIFCLKVRKGRANRRAVHADGGRLEKVQ